MKSNTIGSLVVFILSIALLFSFLGLKVVNPNSYVFGFGGDPAILYFNMIYHTLYGDGLHLSNMNYPMGESLLMTDAQASISWILHHLRSIQFVQDNIVGFVHSFHYLCLGLGSVFAFKLFRKLDVHYWIAIFGALLIVFLSPQLIRLKAHFGLAYPIVFTGVLYSIISLEENIRLNKKIRWKYAILLFSILLFFGFNNIYLLMIGAGMTCISSLMYYLIYRKKQMLWLTMLGILPVIIVYVMIKGSDPGMDRLLLNWGYFDNRMSLKGIFCPHYSLLGKLLKSSPTIVENITNLGVANIVMLAIAFLSLFTRRGRNGLFLFFKTNPVFVPLLGSSLMLLYYSFGRLEFLAEVLPAVTMFKASGRFAWAIYYVLSFISIAALDKIYKHSAVSQIFKKWFVIIVLFLWGMEVFNYVQYNVKPNTYHNHYAPSELSKISNQLKDLGIDSDDYQAIFSIPVMVAWNDKVRVESPWSVEYGSTRLSMATGLPLINAMLSRIGLTQANNIMQFAGHPLLEKKLLTQLDERPIFLVVAKNGKLAVGEEHLLNASKLITELKHVFLYRLEPNELRNMMEVSCSPLEPHWYYQNYDNLNKANAYFGDSGKQVQEDEVLFFKGNLLEDSIHKNEFVETELSLAVFTDNYKYGMPRLKVRQYDKNEKEIKVEEYYTASAKNIDGNWRLISFLWKEEVATDSISVSIEQMNQTFYIDELLIRPKIKSPCIYLSEDEEIFMINNAYK